MFILILKVLVSVVSVGILMSMVMEMMEDAYTDEVLS